MGHLECSFRTSLTIDRIEDFVRDVRVDVCEFSQDGSEKFVIGRILMNHLSWSDAIRAGTLTAACTSHSVGLLKIFKVLTNNGPNLREDLGIVDMFLEVIVVHQFLLHPDFMRHRRAILDSTLTLFGFQSLATMWMSACDLTEDELSSLGFQKIAGEELIYRHSGLQNKFWKDFPLGQPMNTVARPEHESWFLKCVDMSPVG